MQKPPRKQPKPSVALWQTFFESALKPEHEANSRSNVARANRIIGERIRSALHQLKGQFSGIPWVIKFADKTEHRPTGFELEQLRRATGNLKPSPRQEAERQAA